MGVAGAGVPRTGRAISFSEAAELALPPVSTLGDAVEQAEGERADERRGNDVPPELATVHGRRSSLREAKGSSPSVAARDYGATWDQPPHGQADAAWDEPPRYRRAPHGSELDPFEPVIRQVEEWPRSARGG